MLAKPTIEEREHNSEPHTRNICNSILYIRAAPKGGLHKLYDATKRTGSHKDRDQSKAACAGQWKGERCEGNEVYKFVGAIRRWGRLIDRPKHGDC